MISINFTSFPLNLKKRSVFGGNLTFCGYGAMQFTPKNEGPPQNSIADGEIRKSVTPVTKSIERNVLGGWVGGLKCHTCTPQKGGVWGPGK